MTFWGGYRRYVRYEAARKREARVWVCREHCRRCGHGHAMLAAFMLERRLDTVEVIGLALAVSVFGEVGHRKIAAALGSRPATTVGDWLRRYRRRAEALLVLFRSWAWELGATVAELSGSTGEMALQVLVVMWQRAKARLGAPVPELWPFAAVVTGGKALACNTSPSYEFGAGGGWMASHERQRHIRPPPA
jgi:hypothetical protein